jgi:transcriptional regulator with XRE-family HTH domain
MISGTDNRLIKIAQKLKELREKSGYSSYETFALDHNLDRKQYWRIEKGSNITLKSLIKILDIHNMNLKKFFSDIH